MKISKTLLGAIVLIVLATGILAGWWIFGRETAPTEKKSQQAIDSNETIYTCSMHPQVEKKEPGQCPICGMELIPMRGTDDEMDPRAVQMSATAMRLADVRTAIVKEAKSARKQLRLNGKVQVDQRRVTTQSSHIPGRIEKLMVDFEGESVRKGQVIAHLYSPELVTAQQELIEARSTSQSQPGVYQAALEKLRKWKLSEGQIERIKKAQQPIAEFPVRADAAGYVLRMQVNEGDYIQKGEPLYRVADLSGLWVEFDVYESDLQWLETGDSVVFSVGALPGEEFEGSIAYLDPVINADNRAAKARVNISNADMMLKPGMFTTGVVRAGIESEEHIVVVPKSAVMWTGTRSVVYVKKRETYQLSFVLREVTLGADLGSQYIVKEGLKPGEEIAVNGTFSIDAAAQLNGKPSMMQSGKMAAKNHLHSGHIHENEVSGATSGTDSTQVNDAARTEIRDLVSGYLKIKNLLVGDQFDQARLLAGNLAASLAKDDGGSDTTWPERRAEIRAVLRDMSAAKNIGEVRAGFVELSERMINLTKTLGTFGAKLYIQRCPMANSSKGADWLSTDQEIRNPYYGSSMLRCGSVMDSVR